MKRKRKTFIEVEHQQLESANRLKSRSIFEVSEERLPLEARGYLATRPFRDPAALDIVRRIAFGLRERGYEVTEPKHGRACDAIFRCRFKGFNITLILLIDDRKNGTIKGRMVTWKTRKPLLTRLLHGELSTPEMKEWWKGLSSALDRQLRDTVGEEVHTVEEQE